MGSVGRIRADSCSLSTAQQGGISGIRGILTTWTTLFGLGEGSAFNDTHPLFEFTKQLPALFSHYTVEQYYILGSTLPILSLLTSWFTGQADVVVITDLLLSQQGPCLTVRHTPTPPSPTAIGGKSPSLKNWAGSQLQPKGGASGDLVHGAVEQSKNYHYQILYDDGVQKLIKAGAKQKKTQSDLR